MNEQRLRKIQTYDNTLLPRPNSPLRSRTSLDVSLLKIQSSLHSSPSYCLSILLLLSTFGISLERRTVIGKALSAPLATMALALTVANVGFLPFDSPLYSGLVNQFLIPLAVPLLLFDSNLRRVIKDTGSLLVAFLVGAFATVVGTLGAVPLVPMPKEGWKVASALAARHIGGAINFVAVADTLQVPGTVVSAAIAADNVVVALYFAFLFSLSKAGEEGAGSSTTVPRVDIQGEEEYNVGESTTSSISLPSIAVSLSVASVIVTVSQYLTKSFLPIGTSALPLSSVLTVTAATLFPLFFQSLRTTGTALGIVAIQLFFAASGASGSIRLVLQQAPTLFLFSTIQIAIHFAVLILLGRGFFRLPFRELYLASNANVGGPTTAAAMAQAKEWPRLVLPALLTGILGYATATAIALALGPLLQRLPLVWTH